MSPASHGQQATGAVPTRVTEFRGEYRFLSNFWPCVVQLDGVTYPSVEHAYVAAKTLDPDMRAQICATPNTGVVKRLGRTLALRPDWEQKKFAVMADLVAQKFRANDDLRRQLLETGDAVLEEGNTWGDRVWGVCPPGSGQGANRLGKLLMDVRAQLALERDGVPTPREYDLFGANLGGA